MKLKTQMQFVEDHSTEFIPNLNHLTYINLNDLKRSYSSFFETLQEVLQVFYQNESIALSIFELPLLLHCVEHTVKNCTVKTQT